jgi:uncharacterized protein (UPF0254 family)
MRGGNLWVGTAADIGRTALCVRAQAAKPMLFDGVVNSMNR